MKTGFYYPTPELSRRSSMSPRYESARLEIFSRDPEVMRGELVFTGTRTPAKTPIDCSKATWR